MKLVSSFTAGALLAGQALAYPTGLAKRQGDIDITVLQFALTLEHLENVFYKQALETLSEQMFVDAGFDATYYTNVKFIASDEMSHVEALSAALTAAGATPNEACEYNFPFTDVTSFITLSSVLEGVGTSAYLGAAGLITSKDYLTVAGSILAVEALHTSLQRSSRGLPPAANPYYTPLSPNPVFTLAASFITSCPSSNGPLPFMAFPTLISDSDAPLAAGMPATFSFEGDKSEDDKSEGHTSEDHKSEGHHSQDDKSEGENSKDAKDEDHKSEYHKRESDKSEDHKSEDHKSEGHKSEDHKNEGHKSEGHKSEGHKSEGHKSEGHKSEGHKSEGHKSEGHKSEGHKSEGQKYITFVSGLTIESVMVEGDGPSYTATIPTSVQGQSYVFLTNWDVSGGPGALTDSAIIAGPAVIEVTPPSPTHEDSY